MSQIHLAISDADIISTVCSGKTDEFALILKRYWPGVKGLIRKTINSPEQIEDLCQETFLRAFNSLGKFDLTRKFGPWVYKIAINVVGEYFRREAKNVSWAPLDDRLADKNPSPENRVIGRSLIDHFLEGLPWQHRLLLILKHGLMLNYEEIAEILDEPVGSVKCNLFRIRKMLQTAKKKYESQHQFAEIE